MADDLLFPSVVAVRALTGFRLIGGGETVAVRFTAADEQTMAVLIPQKISAGLLAFAPVQHSPEQRLAD